MTDYTTKLAKTIERLHERYGKPIGLDRDECTSEAWLAILQIKAAAERTDKPLAYIRASLRRHFIALSLAAGKRKRNDSCTIPQREELTADQLLDAQQWARSLGERERDLLLCTRSEYTSKYGVREWTYFADRRDLQRSFDRHV